MATGAIHRSAPCGIALRGPFTPGTGELCRTRRAPSRSVPRARLISPSAACTQANAATSIWPPPCPSPASCRRAARARLYAACHGRFPAAEAASGLQFRISRVVGLVNQLANQAKKVENDTRWQQKRKHALRITMLCHAQKLCEAHLPPEPTRYAAQGAAQARSYASHALGPLRSCVARSISAPSSGTCRS